MRGEEREEKGRGRREERGRWREKGRVTCVVGVLESLLTAL